MCDNAVASECCWFGDKKKAFSGLEMAKKQFKIPTSTVFNDTKLNCR